MSSINLPPGLLGAAAAAAAAGGLGHIGLPSLPPTSASPFMPPHSSSSSPTSALAQLHSAAAGLPAGMGPADAMRLIAMEQQLAWQEQMRILMAATAAGGRPPPLPTPPSFMAGRPLSTAASSSTGSFLIPPSTLSTTSMMKSGSTHSASGSGSSSGLDVYGQLPRETTISLVGGANEQHLLRKGQRSPYMTAQSPLAYGNGTGPYSKQSINSQRTNSPVMNGMSHHSSSVEDHFQRSLQKMGSAAGKGSSSSPPFLGASAAFQPAPNPLQQQSYSQNQNKYSGSGLSHSPTASSAKSSSMYRSANQTSSASSSGNLDLLIKAAHAKSNAVSYGSGSSSARGSSSGNQLLSSVSGNKRDSVIQHGPVIQPTSNATNDLLTLANAAMAHQNSKSAGSLSSSHSIHHLIGQNNSAGNKYGSHKSSLADPYAMRSTNIKSGPLTNLNAYNKGISNGGASSAGPTLQPPPAHQSSLTTHNSHPAPYYHSTAAGHAYGSPSTSRSSTPSSDLLSIIATAGGANGINSRTSSTSSTGSTGVGVGGISSAKIGNSKHSYPSPNDYRLMTPPATPTSSPYLMNGQVPPNNHRQPHPNNSHGSKSSHSMSASTNMLFGNQANQSSKPFPKGKTMSAMSGNPFMKGETRYTIPAPADLGLPGLNKSATNTLTSTSTNVTYNSKFPSYHPLNGNLMAGAKMATTGPPPVAAAPLVPTLTSINETRYSTLISDPKFLLNHSGQNNKMTATTTKIPQINVVGTAAMQPIINPMGTMSTAYGTGMSSLPNNVSPIGMATSSASSNLCGVGGTETSNSSTISNLSNISSSASNVPATVSKSVTPTPPSGSAAAFGPKKHKAMLLARYAVDQSDGKAAESDDNSSTVSSGINAQAPVAALHETKPKETDKDEKQDGGDTTEEEKDVDEKEAEKSDEEEEDSEPEKVKRVVRRRRRRRPASGFTRPRRKKPVAPAPSKKSKKEEQDETEKPKRGRKRIHPVVSDSSDDEEVETESKKSKSDADEEDAESAGDSEAVKSPTPTPTPPARSPTPPPPPPLVRAQVLTAAGKIPAKRGRKPKNYVPPTAALSPPPSQPVAARAKSPAVASNKRPAETDAVDGERDQIKKVATEEAKKTKAAIDEKLLEDKFAFKSEDDEDDDQDKSLPIITSLSTSGSSSAANSASHKSISVQTTKRSKKLSVDETRDKLKRDQLAADQQQNQSSRTSLSPKPGSQSQQYSLPKKMLSPPPLHRDADRKEPLAATVKA